MGALVGAILMCGITLIPRLNVILYLFVSYFLSSIVIVTITFKPNGLKEIMQLTLLLYIISLLLGGLIFALYYYSMVGYGMNRLMDSMQIKGIDLQMLALLACFAVFLSVILINICFKVIHVSRNIYDVAINFQSHVIHFNGLLDTGNNLYDPITNWPVIIGEVDIFKKLLSEQEFAQVEKAIANIYDVGTFEQIKKLLGLNIRLIPYSSLGNENGMLLGVVLDKVDILIGKQLKENKNVIIALYNKKLSKDNSYSLLLHPKLI